MIRHIVMWKLDESYSIKEKQDFTKEFSTRLMQLEGNIEQLQSISVHFNSADAPDSNYDLLLDTSFKSIEDLNKYAINLMHVEVVEFSKPFKKQRSCVDYEY